LDLKTSEQLANIKRSTKAAKLPPGAQFFLDQGLDAAQASELVSVMFARIDGPFRPAIAVPLVVAFTVNMLFAPTSYVAQITIIVGTLVLALAARAYEKVYLVCLLLVAGCAG
jgi:type IV secretory pathway VirB2 component (pilin)